MKKSLTKNKQYIKINSWVVKKITIHNKLAIYK